MTFYCCDVVNLVNDIVKYYLNWNSLSVNIAFTVKVHILWYNFTIICIFYTNQVIPVVPSSMLYWNIVLYAMNAIYAILCQGVAMQGVKGDTFQGDDHQQFWPLCKCLFSLIKLRFLETNCNAGPRKMGQQTTVFGNSFCWVTLTFLRCKVCSHHIPQCTIMFLNISFIHESRWPKPESETSIKEQSNEKPIPLRIKSGQSFILADPQTQCIYS